MDGIICVHEPGGRIFKKVFINFLSSSLVVALVPGGLPLLPFSSLKDSAACEMAVHIHVRTFGPTNGQNRSNMVGFGPNSGQQKSKNIFFPK